MALLDMIQQKKFLGTEFLTWLWYRAEIDDGTIEIEHGHPCEVVFEKDLLLSSEAGQALASSLKGDSPATAPEAVAALLAGKKVKRARITLSVDSTTWEMVLHGETFDWGGLKIDTPPSLPLEEAIPIRLNALEEFDRIFSRLYAQFLDLRLDAAHWKKEVTAIRKWAKSKNTANPGEE